jgi:hypothetical protein
VGTRTAFKETRRISQRGKGRYKEGGRLEQMRLTQCMGRIDRRDIKSAAATQSIGRGQLNPRWLHLTVSFWGARVHQLRSVRKWRPGGYFANASVSIPGHSN